MAKKSKIAKNEQRKEVVARFAERRNELKAIIKNPNTSDEDRLDAQFELNRQPRDASQFASVTVTPAMVAHVASCVSSVFPVSACARWLTAVSFRASVSPAGNQGVFNEAQ